MYTIAISRQPPPLGAFVTPPVVAGRAPLIITAPFSAIMIVGAFVLVDVTASITEASMTLCRSVWNMIKLKIGKLKTGRQRN
jgi:hypothetical protein